MAKESRAMVDVEELLSGIFYLCEEVLAGGQTGEVAIEKIRIAVEQYALNHELNLSRGAEHDSPQDSDIPF